MEFACFRDHRFVLRQFETPLLSLLWSVNKNLSLDVSIDSSLPVQSPFLCCLARWVLTGPALLNVWVGQCGFLSSGSL